MELDTGSSVSLISEETFKQLQDQGTTPSQLQAKLCTVTGQAIKIMGLAEVKVECHSQVIALPPSIVRGKGPSLLGRNWLEVKHLD